MDTQAHQTPKPSADHGFSGTAAAAAHPRGPRWLRVALAPVGLVVAALSPLLVHLPLSLVPGLSAWLNDPANLSVAFLVDVVTRPLPTVAALLIVGLLVTRLDGRRLRDAGVVWTRYSAPLLALGVGVSAAVVLVTMVVFQGSARPLPEPAGPLWFALWVGVASAFLLQGFPEELFMRGYLMQTLRDRPLRAIAVSTLLFGVLHIVSSGGQQDAVERLVYLLNPMAFGFCAAALVLLTRSLWPAVGIHAGFHLAVLAGALLGLSFDGPVLWAGAAVGYAVVGVGVLVALRRRRGGEAVVLER